MLLSTVLRRADGDAWEQFNDSYVKLGADGGRQAANHLAGLIKQHLAKDDGPVEPSWRIHMHIFGSVPKLAKNYQENGLVQNPATFNAFIKAFNRERGFFQAMDVTDQKQSADLKVKSELRRCWRQRKMVRLADVLLHREFRALLE